MYFMAFLYLTIGFFIGVNKFVHKVGQALGGLFYSLFWLPILIASIITGIENKYS